MGEKLDALEAFHPDRMAQRILGMGDVLSLIERGLDVPLSFNNYPHEQEWLLNLRERVNREIRFAVENN